MSDEMDCFENISDEEDVLEESGLKDEGENIADSQEYEWDKLRGVGGIGCERSEIDFQNYKPSQIFNFSLIPLAIVTVRHDLASNIIGILFEDSAHIYDISLRRNDKEEFFTFEKLQEFSISSPDSTGPKLRRISSLSISSASNISEIGGDKKLLYALSIIGENCIYVATETTSQKFTPALYPSSSFVSRLEGLSCGGVTYLSFDGEKGDLLATLTDDFECIIWSISTRDILTRITLKSPGVSCLWHRSEPYKLLITERTGNLYMFNALKLSTIFSMSTGVSPIYSIDWSNSDSNFVIIGGNKCAYIYDLSLLNSEHGKRVESHYGPTHLAKFSSLDSNILATATMFGKTEIKLFKKNLSNYLWCHRPDSVQSIAFVEGENFLMSLSGKKLLIYEISIT